MNDTDTYERLSKPFDKTHKKKDLDYITGEQAVSRLNDVLGFDGWSFKVIEHGYNDAADEFWALGELTIHSGPPAVIQQFGSQKPNRYRADNRDHPNEIIDLGFDLKGAVTDALKKCASLRGVGLYLHEKEGGQPAAVTVARDVPAKGETTTKKASTLMEIAAQMGFGRDMVIATAQESFGNRMPSQLNKAEAQRLLVILEDKKKASAA